MRVSQPEPQVWPMDTVNTHSIADADRGALSLTISPLSLLKWPSVMIAILGLLHMVALPAFLMGEEASDKRFGRGIRYLILLRERSVGTWFSAALIIFNAAMLFLNGAAARQLRLGSSAQWLFLAAIFTYLSMDEMLALHERLGTVAAGRLVSNDIMTYPWVVTGLVFTVVVGLSFVGFLYRLPRRTAKLFMLAGAIYVGGALGMEVVEGITATHFGTATLYYFEVLVEKCMEMFGQALFAYALLDHLARRRVNIHLSTN